MIAASVPLPPTDDPSTWPAEGDRRPDLPGDPGDCPGISTLGWPSLCTRNAHHDGPHVALGRRDRVCAVWATVLADGTAAPAGTAVRVVLLDAQGAVLDTLDLSADDWRDEVQCNPHGALAGMNPGTVAVGAK